MYDTNKLNKNTDLFDKVTEYDIYAHYIGSFKIGTVFSSPLREKDNNPSFGIFISRRTGSLLYKDLSTGDSGNCIKFVKQLFKLTTYKDVYDKINIDMQTESRTLINTNSNKKVNKKTKHISIKRRSFSVNDLLYWKQYGITEELLKLYNVFSISAFFIDDIVCKLYTSDEPMFAYKIFNHFKIYRPLSAKKEKWFSNTTEFDLQGYEQLPSFDDVLIITKALKDVMSLRMLGYNAVAPLCETSIIPNKIMLELTKRFKTIIVLYDRDRAGFNGTKSLLRRYNYLDFLFVNKKYGTKDISDTIKKIGIDKTKTFIDSNINKILKRYETFTEQ